MSTTHATEPSGGSPPDMRHVNAGRRRWLKQQDRLKTRELKSQLAEERRRETQLQRSYSRAFDRAAGMSDRRGVQAISDAFDEADRLMARLFATRASIEQLEGKLRA